MESEWPDDSAQMATGIAQVRSSCENRWANDRDSCRRCAKFIQTTTSVPRVYHLVEGVRYPADIIELLSSVGMTNASKEKDNLSRL